jgi:signal transduction histidine kinase
MRVTPPIGRTPPAGPGAFLDRLASDIQSLTARPSAVHVLLVDDDASIRDALAEHLEDEGYVVSTAVDGADALRVLRAGAAPSVILLDLMMPVMTGWQFRIEQKNDASLAHIPVIALSANNSPEARAIDAALFLPKPPDPSALSAAINGIVARAKAMRLEHTERLAAVGTLTAGVAHEIANLLSCILSNLEGIAPQLPAALKPGPSEIPELVGDSVEAARRMREIVDHIRTVSRIARDETIEPIDLGRSVERAVRILGHQIHTRSRVALNLSPTPKVAIHAGRVEQVVINLLLNAAHAVADNPRSEPLITVSTLVTDSGRVRLEVADTGPGVPQAIAARIFEPFFTTKPVDMGTGLGLSICRAIVEDAGGAIGFTPAPTGGALFWVELSAYESPAAS